MTFSEAFTLHGPDSIAISEAMDVPEYVADHFINEAMEAIHTQKVKREARKAYQREWVAKTRSNLREIRAGRQG
jgi:hypothetical protein